MTKRKCILFMMLIAALNLWCAFAATETFSQNDDVWLTDAQGNLIIHTDRVTHEPVFIPLMVNGNRMEILAIRAMDGNVRVAFNTCQVCSGAPSAYFDPQEGGVVCRNCGNFFLAEQVGSAAHGCNPLAVPGVEATASGDIVISAAVLMAHVKAFRNWKRGL